MGKKIRLTESEFHNLIKRLVKETEEEMMDLEMETEDQDMEEDGGEELSKGEVVDLISKFFKHEVLPELDFQDKEELRQEVGEGDLGQLSEMYLNEDLGERISNFKEKAMMRGGLGMAAAGAVSSVSQMMGWSESETLSKIHEFVDSFGMGNYAGPISLAMVAAGLALALKGRSMKFHRTGK